MSEISYSQSEAMLTAGQPTFCVVIFPREKKDGLTFPKAEIYFDDWIEAMDRAIFEYQHLRPIQRRFNSVRMISIDPRYASGSGQSVTAIRHEDVLYVDGCTLHRISDAYKRRASFDDMIYSATHIVPRRLGFHNS